MSQQSFNYTQTQNYRDQPYTSKNMNEMVRSMITEGYGSQTYTPPSRVARISELMTEQQDTEEVAESNSMILTSRKSRKYSEAAFNQELMQNMNRSKVFESKIMEPLRFADKDKVKSPKVQQLNKTVFEIVESPHESYQQDYQNTKRSNLIFSSTQLDKNLYGSPKFTFQNSTKKDKQQGESTIKKSVNDYVNIRTQQYNMNFEQKSQANLNKFKTPLLKSTNKDSYIFKRQEISNYGIQSEVVTPKGFSPPKDKQLKKGQTFSTSNMNNFFKKPSIEDKVEPFSPFKKPKQVETKDGSNSELTPTESLRSSIDKLSKQDFYFGKRLGKGKFGDVFLAKHKDIGFLCAMKIISKKVIISEKIQNQLISQIKIQLFLSHPNIVALYGIFSDKQNIYLMQQPCMQGQLYQKIKKMKRVPEKEASSLIKQVVIAVDYLHTEKIIHRDIKPQNILLSDGVIKICDFGWAAFHNDQFRDTFCGTPLYLSPELLNQNNYDDKVDNWAIGILAYEILVGRIPFKITTKQELEKILHEEIVFPENLQISEAAKKFILMMLERNPVKRADLESCLSHPFFGTQA